MNQFLIALLTGLTTGGLSCLAVQGGLLASSVAQQIEQDLTRQAARSTRPRGSHRKAQTPVGTSTNPTRPILLFLLAKLVAYSLLGMLLGAFGSVFNLSAITRALLQYAIGIFMIGNALRMFNVHPIFRYFSFEPPGFIRRLIRKLARREDNPVTPLFLGALTVFIPCGVTQVMMALAVSSGSPAQGFVIMSGFTLGTLPVFFALAYFATRLGAKTERYFMQFTAAILLAMGLVAVNSGLVLSGSPYSINHLTWQWRAGRQSAAMEAANLPENQKAPTLELAGDPNSDRRVIVNATNTGYTPEYQQFASNTPFELVLVTDNTLSCARAFVVPALGIEALLPVDGQVAFDINGQPAGSRLFYTCSMGMYGGFIEFTE